MDRLLTLQIFVAVADTGSFVGAARALRISAPKATRGISALEERLGVALFHRSTRAVALTDEGAGFLEKARRIIAELSEAERELVGGLSEPQGELHITAPVMFGRLHVLPVLTEMLDRHPKLSANFMLLDRNIRIVEEGIDVAVRIGQLADTWLKAKRIGSVHPTIVASPAYLARYGVPQSADELLKHRLIATTGPRSANEWRFALGRDSARSVAPKLRLNSVSAAISAAESGAGIANLLSYQVEQPLKEGRLIALLPELPFEELAVHLLFEASRGTAPAVRAFIENMDMHFRNRGWR